MEYLADQSGIASVPLPAPACSTARCPLNSPYGLPDIAEYYERQIGRVPLERDLHAIFTSSFTMQRLHTYLATLPNNLLIVTTNYDDLLEQAFLAQGREYDVIIHPLQPGMKTIVKPFGQPASEKLPKDVQIDLATRSVIYKLHGSPSIDGVSKDRYLITEEDFLHYLTGMSSKQWLPHMVTEHCLNTPFLFLGFGLQDINVRLWLHQLRLKRLVGGSSSPLQSWAVLGPSPSSAVEETITRKIWEFRHVTLLYETIEDFLNAV